MDSEGEGRDRPPYQDALRAIGRYFDEQIYRNVLVCEVVDGYVARAFPTAHADSARAEGLQFLSEDVSALIQRSKEAHTPLPDYVKMPTLCPTGYEDFFRALGWECDQAGVRLISVSEMREGILVNYYQANDQAATGGVWHQMFYDDDGVTTLLNQGFARRGEQ